jgi:uncharacterized repeat protein (TIGR01451 family)
MRRLGMPIIICLLAAPVMRAMAAGTAAGTIISVQAMVSYQVGPSSFSQSSNPVSATVAEVLDVAVTWQDLADVTVSPGETQRMLTFKVTNTGNGTEQFRLTADTSVSGDAFDPVAAGIFLDSNGNGIYDQGVDQPCLAGTNDPVLAADAGLTVFAAGNIPSTVRDGDTGNFELTATAVTGHGPPGTRFPAKGAGGTVAIVGTTGALNKALGTFAVSDISLAVTKTAVVVDPYGGNRATTGAVITYQVQVLAQGSGEASGVIFSDPLPAHTLYKPNSLNLNAAALTDTADSDAGDVGITAADTVTVRLGDLAAGAPVQTITFAVTVN